MKRLFKFLSLVSAISMVVAHFSISVDPRIFYPFAYLGLILPILIYLNISFLLLWVIKLKRAFLWPMLAFVVCYSSVQNMFSIKKAEDLQEQTSIKVLTYNVKNFDLYNWSKNEAIRTAFIQLIDSIGADIICIQEFYEGNEKPFKNIQGIMEKTGLRYHFFSPSVIQPYRTGDFGTVIFSAFPIIGNAEFKFSEKTTNGAMYIDIKYKKDTVRIYNIHLESIRIAQQEFEKVTGIEKNEKQGVKAILNIMRRMKVAYKKRAAQAIDIAKTKSSFRGPIILCGDFNDTPFSFSYKKIKGELLDAFTSSGLWYCNTIYKPFPMLRIDNILYSPHFKASNYTILDKELSDHKPVITRLELL